MAAPVWLSSVSGTRIGESVPDLSAAYSGIIILGVADSAASALGRRFGRRRILGTRKTLEGTLGGVACTLAAWLLLRPLLGCGNGADGSSAGGGQGWWQGFGGAPGTGSPGSSGDSCGVVSLWSMAIATVASCVLEAATTQLDNIFLPLHHYAMMAA
jgi:dolichol kinase